MGDLSVKWLTIGLGASALLTAGVLLAPTYLLVALAAVVAAAVATKPMGRLALFVFGGMVTMGGASGLGANKIAYAALVGLLVIVGLIRVLADQDEEQRAATRSALVVSALLGGLTIGGGRHRRASWEPPNTGGAGRLHLRTTSGRTNHRI
jgi:hypothetical protein